MQMLSIPFGTTDWSEIEQTEHKGESGMAYWRTKNFGDIRVRMVELQGPFCDFFRIISSTGISDASYCSIIEHLVIIIC